MPFQPQVCPNSGQSTSTSSPLTQSMAFSVPAQHPFDVTSPHWSALQTCVSRSQTASLAGQSPHEVPHPSSPQFFPSQLHASQEPVKSSQYSLAVQLPHATPHSKPQSRPAHGGSALQVWPGHRYSVPAGGAAPSRVQSNPNSADRQPQTPFFPQPNVFRMPSSQ
jgi:hypothetical protein